MMCVQMEEQRKEKMNRRDNWIAEVIFINIICTSHTHTHTGYCSEGGT